jgi:hypothetical protein
MILKHLQQNLNALASSLPPARLEITPMQSIDLRQQRRQFEAIVAHQVVGYRPPLARASPAWR